MGCGDSIQQDLNVEAPKSKNVELNIKKQPNSNALNPQKEP